MQIQRQIYDRTQWRCEGEKMDPSTVDLVTVFGHTDEFVNVEHYTYLKELYPKAQIIGCSSSGNIIDSCISNDPIIATAISFKSSKVILKSLELSENENVEAASERLAKQLDTAGLKHIFILADGLSFNGSDIVKAFNKATDIPKSGGLAGDGSRFEKTLVMANAPASQGIIAALGFYGDTLAISSGYCGGWSEFGTQRIITKSKSNVLYELDGEPALDLYKKYLGEQADELPNSGLRFPLSIKEKEGDAEIIRTLLAVNEEEKSITFAGDVNEGYSARLMKPDINSLVDGAAQAAKTVKQSINTQGLALIVSCVGRRLVMNQLIDDELEAVEDELGDNVKLTGFYSYGEISPCNNDLTQCDLHNQTMTITLIYED